MKLTTAQQNVLDIAKNEIDMARNMTYDEWLLKTQCHNNQDLYNYWYRDNPEAKQRMFKYYENEKNGIVLTHCNSRTLEKLQALGLIEIIHDSKNDKTSYGIDHVKILNY